MLVTRADDLLVQLRRGCEADCDRAMLLSKAPLEVGLKGWLRHFVEIGRWLSCCELHDMPRAALSCVLLPAPTSLLLFMYVPFLIFSLCFAAIDISWQSVECGGLICSIKFLLRLGGRFVLELTLVEVEPKSRLVSQAVTWGGYHYVGSLRAIGRGCCPSSGFPQGSRHSGHLFPLALGADVWRTNLEV